MIFIKADIQTSLVYPNYILQFYTDVLRIFQSLQRYIPRTYLGSIFAMWVPIRNPKYIVEAKEKAAKKSNIQTKNIRKKNNRE